MSSKQDYSSSQPWRLWIALCALTIGLLVLMLSHQSDTPTIFGRYSLTYAFQLATMILLILVFAGLALLSVRGISFNAARFIPKSRALAGVIALSGMIALMIYWAFFPGGRSQPGVMLFAVYSTSLLFVLWLWLLHATGAGQIHMGRWGTLLAVLTLVIAVGLTLATLGHVPPSLFLDEAWIANWGVSWYTQGHPVSTLMPDMSPAAALRGPLFFIGMGVWLQKFGITLANGRLFWLMLAIITGLASFAVLRRWYGTATAAWGAVLFACLLPSHVYLRMDTGVAFFLAIGLWALSRAKATNRLGWYLIAGMAIAWIEEGHLMGFVYAIAFGLMFTWDYVRHLWQSRRWVWQKSFWGFAAGGLLGAALYLFLHSVPWGITPMEWIQSLTQQYGGEQTMGTQTPLLERVSLLTQSWMLDYLLYHPLESALFAAGLGWALTRGDTRMKRLAIIIILAQIGLFLVIPKRSFYYFVFNLPVVVLFAAGLLADLTGRWQRLSLIRTSAFIGLAGLLLTQNWLISQSRQNADRMIALSYEINEALPPQIERVAAWQGYYFGLSDRQFLNSEILYRLPKGITLADLYWPTQPPQALLITLGLDDMQTELFDYIDEHGFVRVRCYPLDIYGQRADLYLRPEDDPYGGVTKCPTN
jgi:hypothetical protein